MPLLLFVQSKRETNTVLRWEPECAQGAQGAACGRDKVCPFFMTQEDIKRTNQERLEDKHCVRRNRWIEKKPPRKKEVMIQHLGLAEILHVM